MTTAAFAIPAPLINASKFGGAQGLTVDATTNVIPAVSKSATMIAQLTGVIMMLRTTVSGALANHQLAATMFDDTRNVNHSMYASTIVLAHAPPSIGTAHPAPCIDHLVGSQVSHHQLMRARLMFAPMGLDRK